MIAVTFALPAESSEFLNRLRNKSRVDRNAIRTIRGTIDDHAIEVVYTGVGEKICRERIGKFLRDQEFAVLISAGFAGALIDELQVGDLLFAKNFSTLNLNRTTSLSSGPPLRSVNLLTCATLIDSSEERTKIARSTGAAAVDMETESIARACAAHAVPLLSLRVITDTPRQPFPAPPHILFDIERQRTNALKLGVFFLKHPKRVPRFIQFARSIARARKTLTDALVEVVRSI